MGNSNRNSEEDININDVKIRNLNNEIRRYMDNNIDYFRTIFSNENYKRKLINFIFNEDDKPTTNQNGIIPLRDYTTNWSVDYNDDDNSTKCQLLLFNIGSFLGANGFLYSISLFYYYFMKIPTEFRAESDIKNDIDNCLKFIDKGNINELNGMWNTNLNNDHLNNLRLAKDVLINLFNEKLTYDIFQRMKCNIIKRIWRKVTTPITHFWAIISFFLTKKLSLNYYIKQKNNINRNYLITKILNDLAPETFMNNNIYIIATDCNKNSAKNIGATFTGYFIRGLGEQGYARRLVENADDGFITGNNGANTQNKLLFDFYYKTIENIKTFFERNQRKIDEINKGINIEINCTEIAHDLDLVNSGYFRESVIDKMPLYEEPISRQLTGCINNRLLNDERVSRKLTEFSIDPERNLEAERILRNLNNENANEININTNYNNNDENRNLIYCDNESENENQELVEALV